MRRRNLARGIAKHMAMQVLTDPTAAQAYGLAILEIINAFKRWRNKRKLRQAIRESLRQLDEAQREVETALREMGFLRRTFAGKAEKKLLSEIKSRRQELLKMLEEL